MAKDEYKKLDRLNDRPVLDYQKLTEHFPSIVRRIDSGIAGEKNALYFIKDAEMEIIKINNFTPSKYCNEYGTDIVARTKKYNHKTGHVEIQYHIFEVTNFKKSTHLNYKAMTEKIDNLIEASYEYPNAKLWLVTSYNQFDGRIKQRIHNLSITVLTSGRVNRVWNQKRFHSRFSKQIIGIGNHSYMLKELRFILDGALTKEQESTKRKVQLIKSMLGRPIKHQLNVIDRYYRIIDDTKITKQIMNQIYKVNTEISKLGEEPEKVNRLLKDGLKPANILYRAKDRLQKIKDKIQTKIEKQKKTNDSVCVRPAINALSLTFSNKSLVAIKDNITGIIYSIKPDADKSKLPDHIREILG